MRRAALAVFLVLVGASSPAAGAEEPRTLYRASATSTAIHGFYDHEGLFPVPIMNVSVPYTDATYEPGPTTSALGSFLWNPQAAELGTIACVLSEGRFCEIPDYPFQARATYPAAGRSEPPPTVSIDEPGSPLRVRAADERAEAGPRGAASGADVVGLAALPMTADQVAAARTLALVAAPLAGGSADVNRWLIEIGGATSRSRTRTDAAGAVAESRAVLHDVALLGGLLRIEAVRGTSVARVAESPRGRAESVVAGVTVAGLQGRVTPRGVTIADRRIPSNVAETLQEALDAALERAGVRLVTGRERVRRTGDGARAETFALSLSFAGRTLPEELPEGTQGRDVVDVPIGYASAEAAVAQILPPAPAPPTPDALPPGGGGAVGVGSGVGGIGGTGGAAGPPVAAPLPAAPPLAKAQPALSLSDLGVSKVALLTVFAAAVLFALGLSWLRVNEVLHEEVLRE